jgi:hypothetical protein
VELDKNLFTLANVIEKFFIDSYESSSESSEASLETDMKLFLVTSGEFIKPSLENIDKLLALNSCLGDLYNLALLNLWPLEEEL